MATPKAPVSDGPAKKQSAAPEDWKAQLKLPPKDTRVRTSMLVVCEDCVTAVEETGGEGEVEADGGEMDDAMEGGGEGEEAEAEGACTHSLPSAMVLGNTPAGAAATTEVDNDVSRFNLQLSSPTLQLSDISHDPNAPKGFHEEPICPPIRDESSQPIPTTGTQPFQKPQSPPDRAQSPKKPGVKDKAPRQCRWLDVRYLLTGGGDKEFRSYANTLNVRQVPDSDDRVLKRLDPTYMKMITRDFESKQLQPRHDDEGTVRPIVHDILQCAAKVAEDFSSTKRTFRVVAEPSVEGNREDRLSDESVVEVVESDYLFRILVEVKGSHAIESDTSKIEIPRLPFCQLIQQVALALQSGRWKDKLLGALSTGEVWLFFEITNSSDSGNGLLHIECSYSIVLGDIPNIEVLQRCLSFMVLHLCN